MIKGFFPRNGPWWQWLAVITAALAAATVLTGCGSSNSSASALAATCLTDTAAPLALVVGVRSNVPTAQFPATATTLLETAANDEQQRDNLIAQWEAIVKASGGCVTADPTGNTVQAVAGLPPVGVVPLPATPSLAGNCGTLVLSDAGSVGFVVGTAAFRDPAAAQTTLSQLAATLKKGTEHIKLIGSTSSEGGDAINNPLSLKRAQAVRSALISLGIPASRITAMGDGSHWLGRVNDIGPGGALLPAQAEQDREVIVQLPKCA